MKSTMTIREIERAMMQHGTRVTVRPRDAEVSLCMAERNVYIAMGDFEDAIRAAESVSETEVLRERLIDLWKRVDAQITAALQRGHQISVGKG